MSQDVYQFIDLQRVDPPEKLLKIRKIKFIEIYESFSEGQVRAQADRCLSYDNPCCEWKCPVHNYIPNWLELTDERCVFEAVELSHQMNTLPGTCGHVCPQDHSCEDSCTLNDEFGAMTIGDTERYISDKAFETDWHPGMSDVKQTGKKVAIIGAGLAGLVCMDVLTRNGVKAIVFDRHPEIGGLLTFGIPAFKLEKEVTTYRREIFAGMGIEFELNTGVGRDAQLDDLLSDYDAMFPGVGAYQSVHSGLEDEDANDVYAVLSFLITNTKQSIDFGETRDESSASMEDKRVVVLGGGDIMMDCMRTSACQEARHVTCAYRHDEENMPGSRHGVKNVREEGVESKFNVQPLGTKVSGNGKVSGVKMARTGMDEPDAKGRRRAEIMIDSERTVPTDAVTMVFGFHLHNMRWLTKRSVELDSQGCIIAPEDNGNAFQTSNPKISTGGGIVRGSDLVVAAIAKGREAADGIVNWLEI